MSMIGNFMQIAADDLEALIQQPDSVESYLFSEDDRFPECCCVDKAWHGIHFLLACNPGDGEDPTAKAVLGGTEIGDDLGYGPARYLTVAEVQEVADAIRPIDREELARRFNARAMAEADIYAFQPEDAEAELEYFTSYYEELKRYYEDAAKNGKAMLLFLT